MRRIAIINQKGGVGKTTTAVNLGAALARLGRRVVVVDMDPQANASLNLGAELSPDEPSTYTILTQGGRIVDTLRGTSTPGLSILPAHLDLSGAELELASTIGRETVLRDALEDWEREEVARTGRPPSDVVFVDNPPSLGLLSVNGLAASTEVLIAVQTEFFALQGLGKLVEIVQLLRRKLNPDLEITGVLACLYDSRLRLAREVLGELRAHFPEQLFRRPIAQNVKLAETPSFSRTIFEYAPDSKGAEDYLTVAREFLEREGVDVDGDPRSLERSDALTTADPHREALSSFEIVPYAADEEEDDQPPAAPDVEPPTVGEVDVPRAEPTSDEPAESATEVAGAVESVTEVATAVQAEPKVAAEPQIIAQPEVIATPETIAEPEVAEVPIEIAVDQPAEESAPAPSATEAAPRAKPLPHRGEERSERPSQAGPLAEDAAGPNNGQGPPTP